MWLASLDLPAWSEGSQESIIFILLNFVLSQVSAGLLRGSSFLGLVT